LIELLRDPLPGGFALVLTLDLSNSLCRQGRLDKHPFDTPAGHKLLEGRLTNSDPGDFSYAVSTAAGLPFIRDDVVRNHLAALAMDHVDPHVQMEAAWASAFRGSDAGVKCLARMAADVRFSVTAQRYLEELGKLDVIPEETRDPDFQAMAEMSNWLAHPSEFGEPPTEIELFDTREMLWPPTNDTRTVCCWELECNGDRRAPKKRSAAAGRKLLGI
jgi:hypothetical protein